MYATDGRTDGETLNTLHKAGYAQRLNGAYSYRLKSLKTINHTRDMHADISIDREPLVTYYMQPVR